jgi:hypothetical protein
MSIRLDGKTNLTVEDEQKVKELAEIYQLIQTAGSDFHGFYSDTQSTIGLYPTNQTEFQKLLECKTNRSLSEKETVKRGRNEESRGPFIIKHISYKKSLALICLMIARLMP